MQDILKQYLATSTSKESLFNYLNSKVITLDKRNREILEVTPAFNTLISQVRKIITITRYTQEPNKLLNQAVNSLFKEGKLKLEKRHIPLDLESLQEEFNLNQDKWYY
ncbi:hypothetical protein BKA59DRAFT_452659 [Fusarium tricinctum]|uniref:Uncharacterized protein n=1 Tax=Fusarium tricinctum TaxID=61284 RepID=A0A8K0WDQ5_9HYPO|nr:hypothetical protein BKA59DRAFT_452659 [Fusarium tricinctum]